MLDRPSLYYDAQVSKEWRATCLRRTVKITDIIDFKWACRPGDLLSITRSPFQKWCITIGLTVACRNGHLPIVELMVTKGATNWNEVLSYACENGHLIIAELMIANGADNWNYSLVCAAQLSAVQLMIEKGANNWNGGLRCAYPDGHLEVAELMISKGANQLNTALHFAC